MDEINQCMQSARAAEVNWRATSVKERLAHLERLGSVLASQTDAWVDLLVRTQHKTATDVLGADVFATLDAIRFLRKSAPRALRKQRLSPSLLSGGWERAEIWQQPYGVVAVAGPWNFPLQLAMIPSLFALAAGNVVILKPSERTPEVGPMIRDMIEQAGLPAGVFQVVDGGSDVFTAVIDSRPDLVVMTGGRSGGRAVYQRCAQHLIPCIMELSGKDAMIILPDANIDRAAKAAAWGGTMNSGQVCLSVEFVYAHETIVERLSQQLIQELRAIRFGKDEDADIGGLANQMTWDHAVALLQDAVERGATILQGQLPDNAQYPHFPPVIITNVNASMRLWNEELFAPILPIVTFKDPEAADVISVMQQLDYGLGATVFARDSSLAKRIAAQIPSGNVSINNVLGTIIRADLPFGGVKQSGFGRYRGIEGIRSFTQSKSVTIHSGRGKRALNWFPYSKQTYTFLRRWLQWSWRKARG
jgi:acyl-CoA reductase-like NAD-dependent aldehyde dehydrogenase